MTRRYRAVVFSAAALISLGAGSGRAADSPARFSHSRGDYLLNCGGCHGFEGVSNVKVVPSLKDLVGYYLRVPEGRAYLARLPNVAFAALDDAHLAALLNYVVFEIGAGSTAFGTKPYGAAEVRAWRRRPLINVALTQYRRKLVDDLIDQHQVPAALLSYPGSE